mmetsp:Transcript_3056/g.7651  ORF Transcript_3056/g.7651 Transcript_3056/m.7651 type:complete len:209 (-) Transcript_3056:326-952(-)
MAGADLLYHLYGQLRLVCRPCKASRQSTGSAGVSNRTQRRSLWQCSGQPCKHRRSTNRCHVPGDLPGHHAGGAVSASVRCGGSCCLPASHWRTSIGRAQRGLLRVAVGILRIRLRVGRARRVTRAAHLILPGCSLLLCRLRHPHGSGHSGLIVLLPCSHHGSAVPAVRAARVRIRPRARRGGRCAPGCIVCTCSGQGQRRKGSRGEGR